MVSAADYGPRGPWVENWPGRCGLDQDTCTPWLNPAQEAVDVRLTWTDCDEAGD